MGHPNAPPLSELIRRYMRGRCSNDDVLELERQLEEVAANKEIDARQRLAASTMRGALRAKYHQLEAL